MPDTATPDTTTSYQQCLAAPAGVDHEQRIIRGYVVAQLGPFKTPGRGEFDKASLRAIITLMKANKLGTKSHFTHPMFEDALGTFLGRSRKPRLEEATNGAGETVPAVRADLHLDATAFDSPKGNLGQYVLDLADSDPAAISSSLHVPHLEEFRRKRDGTLLRDEDDNILPPLWRPTAILASDIVAEGDAVDALLSAAPAIGRAHRELDDLSASLDQMQREGESAEAFRARLNAILDRYTLRTFGPPSTLAKGKLARLLNRLVDAQVNDDRSRSDVVARLAKAAGISAGTVNAILAGNIECPPKKRLRSFAGVIDTSAKSLISAAEADGCKYDKNAAGESGRPLSVLRRKLDLAATDAT